MTLPTASIFYLTLYIATLIIHFLFMGYVLGGSLYIATQYMMRFLGLQKKKGLAEEILVDWLPAMLSGVITAGVAPLLFLQILYQKEYYTANLLLFHRWMSILPVLIVASYALYLLKKKGVVVWLNRLLPLIAVFVFLCFAYTGYSWIENHLLSLKEQSFWTEFYASGKVFFFDNSTPFRFLTWIGLAFMIMSSLLPWQIWYRSSSLQSPSEASSAFKTLAKCGMLGIVIAMGAGAAYLHNISSKLPQLIEIGSFLIGCASIVLGTILYFACCLKFTFTQNKINAIWLSLMSATCAVSVTGIVLVREAIRMESIRASLAESIELHKKAFQVGGFPIFIAFLVLNSVLIFACFAIVRRGKQDSSCAQGAIETGI